MNIGDGKQKVINLARSWDVNLMQLNLVPRKYFFTSIITKPVKLYVEQYENSNIK